MLNIRISGGDDSLVDVEKDLRWEGLAPGVSVESRTTSQRQLLFRNKLGTWVLQDANDQPSEADAFRVLCSDDAQEWLTANGHQSSEALHDQAGIESLAASVPFWWHSIDLGHGVTTPGFKEKELLRDEVRNLQLPSLRGRSVLDIGAFDGYFSFEAERRGAARVVALDHFCWCQDFTRMKPFGVSVACGEAEKASYDEIPENYRAGNYPGKLGFDTAKNALGSRVESHIEDFMAMDVEQLGTFDVVLFLGVLYHMADPVEATRRLAALTERVAIIETEAIMIGGMEDRALCEFFPDDELAHDPTNWWSPNAKAVEGMCRSAGFQRVVRLVEPDSSDLKPGETRRYRAYFHAFK